MDHQAVIDRFAAACRADERVVAATLIGSHARGAADEYSDVDFGVMVTDEAFEAFVAEKDRFVRLLGEPLQQEDFDHPNIVFAILSDGTQVEILFYRESDFELDGPYRVLLDRKNLLEVGAGRAEGPSETERVETVRRQVDWFWHDLTHFIAAMGRGQLWWAHGQLDELRRTCLNLARLREDPSAPAEGFEKVDTALGPDQLARFEATLCPLEPRAMLEAALAIVDLYRDLAPELARSHGVPYPADLDRLMSARLRDVAISGQSPARPS